MCNEKCQVVSIAIQHLIMQSTETLIFQMPFKGPRLWSLEALHSEKKNEYLLQKWFFLFFGTRNKTNLIENHFDKSISSIHSDTICYIMILYDSYDF